MIWVKEEQGRASFRKFYSKIENMYTTFPKLRNRTGEAGDQDQAQKETEILI